MDAMVEPASGKDDPALEPWVQRVLEDHRVAYDANIQSLRVNALHAKKKYDLRRDVGLYFKPGDRVLLIRGEVLDRSPYPKAELPTIGPFTVFRRLDHDRYVLTDLHSRRIHDIVSVRRMLPFPDKPAASDTWQISDPETGGQWPVHSVVGRRQTKANGVPVTQYKVRWSGFGPLYDKWIERCHLDTIAHLISQYEESQGIAPPPLPLAPRVDDAPPPPPSVDNGPHFRVRPHPPEGTLPLKGTPAALPVPTPLTPLPEEAPSEELFPDGTLVDVHYPKEAKWYTGRIVSSYVTRPRTAGVMPERRIVVRYTDAAYKGELFEHGLASSEVRRHHALTTLPDTTLKDPLPCRAQRRLARVRRQLS